VELDLIVLRLLHIVAGVFSVGAAWFFFVFVEPTAAELGPESERFMNGMMVRRKAPIFITIASVTTVLAGLALYWRASAGLTAAWITSGPGIGFTVGAVAAIVAFVAGLQARLHRVGLIDAILLTVAVALMAISRYL